MVHITATHSFRCKYQIAIDMPKRKTTSLQMLMGLSPEIAELMMQEIPRKIYWNVFRLKIAKG